MTTTPSTKVLDFSVFNSVATLLSSHFEDLLLNALNHPCAVAAYDLDKMLYTEDSILSLS